jgi:hypothetical protein
MAAVGGLTPMIEDFHKEYVVDAIQKAGGRRAPSAPWSPSEGRTASGFHEAKLRLS